MKPFLLLSIRAEEEAAEDEYTAFCRFMGLAHGELRRRRLATETVGDLDPGDWSGIVLGGGAFTTSDAPATKSVTQRRVESDLAGLLDRVVADDTPFLGACFGIGVLGVHQGGVVDTGHPEEVGPTAVSLTEEGLADPLFDGLPQEFIAYGGHKEAMTALPAHGVRLATSPACPVQAFRIGRNAYATQFHPELDVEGICTRIEVYKHAGYFDPVEAGSLQDLSRSVEVTEPSRILRNFVGTYAR